MPVKGKRFCLVMVCMMSEWHEVFPSSKADAQARVKVLLVHVISTFETPEFTESDRESFYVHYCPRIIQIFTDF